MRYRWNDFFLRQSGHDSLQKVSADWFYAHETLPDFMIDWWKDAIKCGYDISRIVTATANASHRCVIGDDALCGRFCFAHKEKEGSQWMRRWIVSTYRNEQRRLQEQWLEASLFISTDIEPLPGDKDIEATEITDITKKLLLAMIDSPPAGVILHTHTNLSMRGDILPILTDLNQALKGNFITGVWFETDVVNLPNNLPPPCTSIEDRMKTIGALANRGIKTQAAVAPLVWFEDFESFAKRFPEIWAYRVMVGDLRLDFAIWWTKKAAQLKAQLGLPAPTQEEAKACFESLGYDPKLVAFRDQFYVVLPGKD